MPITETGLRHEHVFPSIPDSWLVLDIGGWHRPLNRADWVMDIQPYRTRNKEGAWDGEEKRYGLPPVEERFTKDTWIQRDICGRETFPFRDKEIDFCVCSETLEDIRDPIWVCSEMNRVAKRGFISCPHRSFESSIGVNSPCFAGSWHHRWIVEVRDGILVFIQKSPLLWVCKRMEVPVEKTLTVLWEDGFEFEEKIFFTPKEYLKDIKRWEGVGGERLEIS